jgi:hypothetical protein
MRRRTKSAEEHLGTLHMATGESFQVQELRRPGRSYGVTFHTSFYEETAKIAKGISSGPTLRVMLILPTILDYQTWRLIDQIKLGAELGIAQSSVSRSLAELEQIGYVEKRGTKSRTEWRLSSDYGWKGSVDSYHQFQRSKGAETSPERPATKPHNNKSANSGQRNLRLLAPIVNETAQGKTK